MKDWISAAGESALMSMRFLLAGRIHSTGSVTALFPFDLSFRG
jgi:hypothetical protein